MRCSMDLRRWRLLSLVLRVAELKGANISGDAPAVIRGNSVVVAVHRPVTVGDHVVEVPVRRIAQPRQIEAWRAHEAALRDHPVPAPGCAVTHRTVNVVQLLPA